MGDCSLFSFLLKPFRLSGIKEPITVSLMQNRELEALKPKQVESSKINQSTKPAKLKNGIIVHGLHTHQGLYSFFQLRQAEDVVPILFNSYVSLATLL